MQMEDGALQGGAEGGIQPLPIPVRRYTENNLGRYFVYTPDGKSHPVEAKTAAEAFKARGVERASRIVRWSDIKQDVLPKGALNGAGVSKAAEAISAAAPPVKQAPAPVESPPSGNATAPPAPDGAHAHNPPRGIPPESGASPRDINTKERLLAGNDFGAEPKSQVESIVEETIARSKAGETPPGKALSEDEVKKLLGE